MLKSHRANSFPLTGPTGVPDGGTTVMLLAGSLLAIEAMRRRLC